MGLIKAVGLVLHPARHHPDVIETILGWARRRGIEVLGTPAEIAAYDRPITALQPTQLARRANLLVSLGGDGTMLRALRLAYPHQTPVLGVNLGRLGFLAEIDIPDLDESLCAIDDDRFTVETRSGLRITTADRSVIAFNDIALLRVPGQGMARVEVQVEGHPFVSYTADAVVVATPTGSTAYSFSAGGPIVSPKVEGLLVTPVAPHSAFNRALFLSHGEKLALRILPASSELGVEVDGQLVAHRSAGTVVDMTVEPAAARVVRLGRTTFYQRTQRKLRLTGSPEST
ncbi:NAD(+)/NADH kinase [Saccharopolyspora phatthalungensis]|uniref:NAD kinase n=1 Tax=Saccharopolyspora phatthalungensis TaxID=664693 RepID=A0A840Q1G7_9PSEU|nr:NAD(+)/NADH kinase [Saccharopolyspora phatthalungensis]MBB5152589.1 NAD+ kinase [Saccharopolyspora phatthalungensis]